MTDAELSTSLGLPLNPTDDGSSLEDALNRERTSCADKVVSL